ncbi:MAG TPA: SAM-dependent chlorinase/fluorinase [Acidimicrobiales bacterium]|nr:SAM-dependent chlorinase/fluorinase [Acidimicrobiales bacterium]
MSTPRPVVFFLSDYGLADEFVGVVHAVLVRLAPGALVVDLTHGIPAFDVRAGAESLGRAVPHLGPGVVLGVVDPGVGSARRSVALRAADGRWFVAPDNGLAVPAADACGGVQSAIALRKPEDAPATFDGRDVLAPAAAALARGAQPATVGDEVDPSSLVRLPPLEVTRTVGDEGAVLRAPVTWIDKFGNVQLGVPGHDGPPADAGILTLRAGGSIAGARRVHAFSDLAAGELGVLVDANGRLALVVREGSAAAATRLSVGGTVELVW